MTETDTTRIRYGAAMVVVAPAVLATGLFFHPFIAVPDEAAIAAAVTADPTRWAVSHMLVAVGSALLILAFLALRRYLLEAGEDRFSAWGLPFIALGSVLFAVLPALEFAPLVAAEIGGDIEAAQAALLPWFLPTLGLAAAAFVIGIYGFGKGIARAGILASGTTRLVVAALGVFAVARFVPLGAFQFYVQGAAGVVALWPLAYRMWTRPTPGTGGSEPLSRPESPRPAAG